MCFRCVSIEENEICQKGNIGGFYSDQRVLTNSSFTKWILTLELFLKLNSVSRFREAPTTTPKKTKNLGQWTQVWVGGVEWSQTFINHCLWQQWLPTAMSTHLVLCSSVCISPIFTFVFIFSSGRGQGQQCHLVSTTKTQCQSQHLALQLFHHQRQFSFAMVNSFFFRCDSISL